MGYWEQNEEGHSFSDREAADKPPMIWGDQPADLVDTAIQAIIAVFVKDIGRLPSRAEMMAGLTFSTAILSLPDRPEDSPEVSDEDIERVEADYYAAFHHEEPHPPQAEGQSDRDYFNSLPSLPVWRVEAGQRIGEVLGRLTKPFEKPLDGSLPPHEGL